MSESKLDQRNVSVGERVTSVIRGWHQYEQKRKTGNDARDFDIAPRDGYAAPLPVYYRGQVIDELQTILHAGVKTGEGLMTLDTKQEDGEFLESRLISSIQFAKELEGVTIPYQTYVEKTTGEEARGIPRFAMDTKRDYLATLAKELGFTYTPEGYQRYREKTPFDPKKVEDKMKKSRDKFVPPLVRAIWGEDSRPSFKFGVVDEDAPWINWTSADEQGFRVRINKNQGNHARWIEGTPEMLTIHEICGHLLQARRFKDLIDSGEINPAYGITTTPGPEQWGMEGLAMVLPRLVPDIGRQLSHAGKFVVDYTMLTEWAYATVALDFIEKGEISRESREYLEHYVPGETDERISKAIGSWTKDPKYRGYHPSYALGSYFFNQLAVYLDAEQGLELVQYLFEKPRTPNQIKRLVADKYNLTEDGLRSPTITKAPETRRTFWDMLGLRRFPNIMSSREIDYGY